MELSLQGLVVLGLLVGLLVALYGNHFANLNREKTNRVELSRLATRNRNKAK
jgi:hypothetical protein